MKRFSQGNVLRPGLLAVALCALSLSPAQADPLHFVIESYPPSNYMENGVLKGTSVDLMKAVMADAGIEYDIELMPWARAYALAQSKEDYCVFSTAQTPEREKLFQWVGPLLKGYNYLVRKKGSNVQANTLEEARKYIVGTQREDYTAAILRAERFERIDETSQLDLTLNKLLLGRVDLMPMGLQRLEELQAKGVQIEPVVILATSIYSMACNLHVPKALIAKMQASLDKMIANGTKTAIFKAYNQVE
jgi:polar amino acid transport system substrate-binding protein